MPNMVMPPGEEHGVGGGLQSLTAFLVDNVYDMSDTQPTKVILVGLSIFIIVLVVVIQGAAEKSLSLIHI